jgi:polygalacturonase
MNKTPLLNAILQSDIDFNGFSALNPGGGFGGGGMPGVFVNVKDAPYNALGDGVSDDTSAINTAMGDVIAAGGGTVFFPHGIYLCSSYIHAYADSNSYSHTDTDSYVYADSDSDSHSDGYCNCNSNRNGYSDAYANTAPYSYSYTNKLYCP